MHKQHKPPHLPPPPLLPSPLTLTLTAAFSQASGLGLPKRQLAPERLLLARTAGFADSKGRAKATSVVDEVVFGKTGADGFIHDQCLQVSK